MTRPAATPWAHHSLIPLIVIDQAALMPSVADALIEGGIPVCEIALRTPESLDAIRAVSDRPGFTVGAGTVLSIEQGQQAMDAGAVFGVSPVPDPIVMTWALSAGWPFVPGAATPGEVWAVMAHGFDTVKIFPVAQLGGPGFLDALTSVFPDTQFLASGGITAETAPEYISRPSVTGVSGSWVAPRSTISQGRLTDIRVAAASWNEAQ